MKKYLLLSSLLCTYSYAHASDRPLSANEIAELQTRQVGLCQIQPRVSANELEMIAQLRFPREFEGTDALDLNVVHGFRQSQAQYSGSVVDTGYTIHDQALQPLAANIRGVFVEFAGIPQYAPVARRFLAEMQFHHEMEDVNPLWILGLPLRFSAAIGDHTADQKTLFSHVPFPSIFFGLTEKDAWKTHSTGYMNIDSYNNKGFELPDEDEFNPSYISGTVLDNISDQVHRALPAVASYPMVNKDKFGVSFIVKCNLNDIFPIGFPFHEKKPNAKPLTAHGITMSTFAFGTHDKLHKLADQRRYYFFQHIFTRGEEYVKAGGNAWQFAEVYPPVAVQKYGRVMGLMNRIYEAMVGKLLPYRGIAEYRKAMTGFFWVDHEEPYMPPHIYETNDADKVIEMVTSCDGINTGSFSIDSLDSWNSAYDPLNTSPIDGSSRLTDPEILEFVEQNLTYGDANGHKYYASPYNDIRVGDNFTLYSDNKVTRGTRFIDVTYNTINGQEFVFSFPTMYHKWLNADDNLGILRYGGTRIEKPDLTTVEDPRAVAIDTLGQIEAGIDSHVAHFQTVAKFFVNQGEKKSLAQKFFKSHFKQEQKVQKLLEQ